MVFICIFVKVGCHCINVLGFFLIMIQLVKVSGCCDP